MSFVVCFCRAVVCAQWDVGTLGQQCHSLQRFGDAVLGRAASASLPGFQAQVGANPAHPGLEGSSGLCSSDAVHVNTQTLWEGLALR